MIESHKRILKQRNARSDLKDLIISWRMRRRGKSGALEQLATFRLKAKQMCVGRGDVCMRKRESVCVLGVEVRGHFGTLSSTFACVPGG